MCNICLVVDLFTGRFTTCGLDNTKADLVITNSALVPRSVCAALCSVDGTCIGFNYHTTSKR